MTVEYLNGTDYARIYGVYDETGKPIGTVEHKIAGREAGKVYCYSLTGKYNKRDIKRFYKENK